MSREHSVKTKLQVQVKPASDTEKSESDEPHYASSWDAISRISSAEGIAGLYAGIGGALVGVASTNFAYFYWYSIVRGLYLRYRAAGHHPSTAAELSLGAAAGALAQLFTIPVAVITTRQQTQKKEDRKGFFDTAREVVASEDGVSGLWRGLKASLVLVVNPAITYGAYERLKDVVFPGKTNLRPWEAFGEHQEVSGVSGTVLTGKIVLGAMSKSLATIATQPLIVAKVGLQSRPPPSRKGKPFKSFVEVMKFIVENEGAMSLFKGMGPQILKGLLVQGILMMTKERCVARMPFETITRTDVVVTVLSCSLSSSSAISRQCGPSSSEEPVTWPRPSRSRFQSPSNDGEAITKLPADTPGRMLAFALRHGTKPPCLQASSSACQSCVYNVHMDRVMFCYYTNDKCFFCLISSPCIAQDCS